MSGFCRFYFAERDMISEKMLELGRKSSKIREIFEYGNRLRAEIGEENVFDFSLGNPSVAPPEVVGDTIKRLIDESSPVELHGYTSAAGDMGTRRAIAEYLNKTYGTDNTAGNIYMTVGAAASLTITLTAIAEEGGEVVVLAPYFPEYRVFVEKAGMVLRECPCTPDTFQIDALALEGAISERTVAVIINSPNNPTGAVYTEESLKSLAELLSRKGAEYGRVIYLISDEPYRELAYEVSVPYTASFYDNTISCYSFSKSLSLPGERIGYINVPNSCRDAEDLFFAVCGAGRALGYVCAPSLMQKVLPHCLGLTSDVSVYDKNRRTLMAFLEKCGYEFTKPDGAFYLFLKAPGGDAEAFCERAKKLGLLLVPSDSFGVSGYVRISYCVGEEKARRSLEAFHALAREYGLI